MFESVLYSDRIASGGVKSGALLATFVRAGLVAGSVFLSGRAIVSSRPPEVIPVLIEGRPVPVKYNFAITLKAAE